jgi:REP element-mobilizing transposase RayT
MIKRTIGNSIRHSLFRTDETDSYYHVVLRCSCREPLATNPKDRRALNAIAIDTIRRFDIKLHAYCLMTNHLRALIQVDASVVIEALRRVATRYSRHRNRNTGTAGNLFERPYTAQRVDSDADFLALLRHIHLNPVISNKVVLPADYPWSSHRAYLGYKTNALITTEYGLSLFANDRTHARAAYHHFISEGIASDVTCVEGYEQQRGEDTPVASRPTSATIARDTCPSVNPNFLLSEEIGSPSRSERTKERRRSRRFLSIY